MPERAWSQTVGRCHRRERIGFELRPIPRREEQAVGVAAQQVVDREHDGERQPFEDDAPQPAAEIRRREREQPEHDPGSKRSRPTGMPSRHMYALRRRRRRPARASAHARPRRDLHTPGDAELRHERAPGRAAAAPGRGRAPRRASAHSGLPACAAAHEAPKLLLGGPASPLRLLLEGAEGSRSPCSSTTCSTEAAPCARISSSSRSATHT